MPDFLSWIQSIQWPEQLPGENAQYLLAPEGRVRPTTTWIAEKKPRSAGVLALLYPEMESPRLLFMQRPQFEKGTHAGQISFPGGGVESTDGSMLDTALREFEEEVGVSFKHLKVMGALTHLYIPPSNYIVYPFVAYIDHKPNWNPDTREVAALHGIHPKQFLDPEIKQIVNINVQNNQITVPAFLTDGITIWGATAMMVSELTAILKPYLTQES